MLRAKLSDSAVSDNKSNEAKRKLSDASRAIPITFEVARSIHSLKGRDLNLGLFFPVHFFGVL